LKRDEATARHEKSKREGTYKSGINMQGVDGYTQDEIDDANKSNKNNKNKRRRTNATICPHCQKEGHSTICSRKCLKYTGTKTTAVLEQVCNNEQDEEFDNGNILPIDASADVDSYDKEPLVEDPNQVQTEEDVAALQAYLADVSGDGTVGVIRVNL
jgi:hypothetical protein